MAFGSGSSLATDCLTRHKGLPFSLKLCKEGKATRLHQTSSSKPNAQSSLSSVKPISRSRRLFSFVVGVWTRYPPLGSLPAHPQLPRQGGPDGLSAHPLFCEASSKLTCTAQSSVHKLV